MLVSEKKFQEEDGSIGYYEAIFESSNILQTTYFPASNRLYISFQRGGVYSYANVTEEMYEELKAAESQGKYFQNEIKSQPDKHPYRKEFTLYPDEVKELKEMVEEGLKENEFTFNNGITNPNPDVMLSLKQDDPANIIFYIEGEEMIKLDEDGFHWKGELVEEDEEIYDNFKEWLEKAMQQQL